MVGAALLSVVLSWQQHSAARDVAPGVKVARAVLRGRVVAADDGQPIRHARISIAPDSGDQPEPVLTNADGRFQFVDLAPARYTLTAAKPGFVATAYAARRALDLPKPITLTPGLTLDGLDVRLARAAAISGRVLDDLGDPVIGVRITAGQIVRTGPRPRLAPVRTTETDDLGEYRIGGLPAGSYVIVAKGGLVAPDGQVMIGGPPLPDEPVYTQVYYPSAASVATARPIVLQTGQEMAAADLTFRAVRTPRLTISITDRANAPASGRFQLMSRDPLAAIGHAGRFSRGIFTTAVEPGDWLLQVQDDEGEAGLALLTIGEDDMSTVVVLTPGATLSGRVVLDGAPPIPFRGLSIIATVGTSPAGVGMGTAVAPDGTFTLRRLHGPVEFALRGAPPGWILTSFIVDGRDLLDQPMDLKGTEQIAGAEIVLTNRGAQLTGTVIDPGGTPQMDYDVIVFPQDAGLLRHAARWTRLARADAGGRFLMRDVPPGHYFAIALPDADETQWSTAEYLDPLRARATRLTLADGDRKSIVLTLEPQR